MTDTKRVTLWVLGGACLIVAGYWLSAPAKPAAAGHKAERQSAARVADPWEATDREQHIQPPVLPVPANTHASLAVTAPGESAGEPWPEDDRYVNRGIDVLLERLSSDDPHLVLDAADGLRARGAVAAIPKLASLDVVKNPDSARSVITALGKLAGMADPANREAATSRLLALLEQEKARTDRDAPGNVLQLYEALGDTSDPRAAAALERELLDPGVPLAALSVVTEALVKLRQPSSIQPLHDARARVSGMTPDDAFMAEVQREVIAAMSAAISEISH